MRKIWIKRTDSFKESEDFEADYYLNMEPSARVETVQRLREMYYKMKKGAKNEKRKGLRRIIKVVQQ